MSVYKFEKACEGKEDLLNKLKQFCIDNIRKEKTDINDFFSNLISNLQNIYFKNEQFIDNFEKYTNNIFLLEEVMMDFFKGKEIPNNYFELLNSIFDELCKPKDPNKKIDSDKKIKYIKKIISLFNRYKAFPFFLKFFNELFEILIYFSAIEQDGKVNGEGKLLGELFIDFISVNSSYFDIFVKIISEKIKLDQPVLAKFLEDWVEKLISLSSEKNCLENILVDFIPWIMKKKNSNVYETMKSEFLIYMENINDLSKFQEKLEQIKICIFTFIKLILNQKESNQQEEYSFLNDLIIKIDNIIDGNNEIVEELFPFETINLFLLLILRAKDINKDIESLYNNFKKLIEKVEYKDINMKEFTDTIEEGIKNPNFKQKENALDWYLFICKQNKNIKEDRELYKEIINIILNYIHNNLEEENIENLFLSMLDKLYKENNENNENEENILILFDVLSDCLINEKHNYLFDYKISGFLNNFLIFSDGAKILREKLPTPKNQNTDNNLELFEKIYKIFAVNPMCLLIFCIYIEEYELGLELILNFKKIKLEDDYYKYLARFSQAIDKLQWNDIRMKILNPNKNIYLIKCLYGVLMLLPQGKAFRILSDRLYSIKGLLKKKDNIDNLKNEDDINKKEQINKYIELFFNVYNEYKK